MDRNNPVIKTLLDRDAEFKSLFTEHEDLEKRLATLDNIHYLTPDQELERKQIQKMKLRGRDRMEQIIHLAGGRMAK